MIALLEDEDNIPVISPDYANEPEFQATFEGMRGNLFQFVDGDGDYWDCEANEIDYIIFPDGAEIDVFHSLKDDE